MKLRDPKLWLALFSTAAVVWVLVIDLERTSPGPLAGAHAQLAELRDAAACDACHGGWLRSMSQACGDCHDGVEADVAEGRGLHGTFTGVEAERCGDCHLDHRGDDFPLVSDTSFTLAGIPDKDAFDHAVLDFTLEGAHAELACTDCHTSADVALLTEGEQRFRGLGRSCAACHEDVHEGRVARACADCHGQEHPFELVATFAHELFPMEGVHAEATCAACHEPGTDRSVEALAGAGPFPPDRGCSACHDSPHRAGFLASVAAGSGDGVESCALCHDAVHKGFDGPRVRMPAELHGASGFPLEEPHAELDCAVCHGAEGAEPFAERHPGLLRTTNNHCRSWCSILFSISTDDSTSEDSAMGGRDRARRISIQSFGSLGNIELGQDRNGWKALGASGSKCADASGIGYFRPVAQLKSTTWSFEFNSPRAISFS